MKKTILFLAFCLLANLFSFFVGCTNADKSKPATAEELSQMNRDFVKALNAKMVYFFYPVPKIKI